MKKFIDREALWEKLEMNYDREDEEDVERVENMIARYIDNYQDRVDALRAKGIEPNVLCLHEWFLPWREQAGDIFDLYEEGHDPEIVSKLVDRLREIHLTDESDFLLSASTEFLVNGNFDLALVDDFDADEYDMIVWELYNNRNQNNSQGMSL